MTDLSKIDFTQLKLEPIGTMTVGLELRGYLSVALNDWITAMRASNGWVIASGANGLTKQQVDELWKRTEQVDEFIRQQSRRRITVIQLVQEIADDDSPVKVIKNGATLWYRFNRTFGRIEVRLDGERDWETSTNMGRHDDTVIILD